MAGTKMQTKVNCISLKATSETMLTGVANMTAIEIEEFLENEEFFGKVERVSKFENAPLLFDESADRFEDVQNALGVDDLPLAKSKLTEMFNLIVEGCDQFVPILNTEGIISAVNSLSKIAVLKHIDVSNNIIDVLGLLAYEDLAFLEGSTGEVHIPVKVLQYLNEIGSVGSKGISTSNGCAIVSITDLVNFAKNIIPE